MPYIPSNERQELDSVIDKLLEVCPHQSGHYAKYVIIKLLSDWRGVSFDIVNTQYVYANYVDNIVTVLKEVDARKSDMNYVLCRILLGLMKPEASWTYITLSNTIGLLGDIEDTLRHGIQRPSPEAIWVICDMEHELRRRLLDPYMDALIHRHGDIPEIKEV